MKIQKLKLNIIPPQTPSTPEEDKKRLAQYIDLLYSWHVEEQKRANEKKI